MPENVEPPEGWAHCYCPTCGRVTTVPSDGPHDLPWCAHHDAVFPWRAGGAESGWTAMKPCIALAEEDTHEWRERDS